MARVKLLRRMAGPAGNFAPGAVVEVADEVAAKLASSGQAEIAESSASAGPIETAEQAAPPETAEAPARPPRRRRRRS